MELLQAEAIWIENKWRPKPHPRDIVLMRAIKDGEVVRRCVWIETQLKRRRAASRQHDANESVQVSLFDR